MTYYHRTNNNRFDTWTVNTTKLQRKCACGQHTMAGGECAACRKKRLQRKAANHTGHETVPPIVHEVLRSPGQPLDAEIRAFMEPRFGQDFSHIRVHTDAKAVESARAVNALAYTVGRDVVFGSGQYAPNTSVGRRLLAHELVHIVQNNSCVLPFELKIQPSYHPAETEAEQVSRHVQAGFNAGRIEQSNAGIALTPASTAIEPLVSYSATDWEVTLAEERAVLVHLRSDPDISRTIEDLNVSGMLGALIDRVDESTNRRELIQILGARLNFTARALVEPHIRALGEEWELQFNLGRLGVRTGAPAFSTAPFGHLISSRPDAPFTGGGATGVNPTSLSIPLTDQALLAMKHPTTVSRYSNPLSSLPGYLATLSPTERAQQAELLLRRPISSVVAGSYGGQIPSRAQIIRAAAGRHNLDPKHVAAFLLAEQRDQSQLEDAKDYLGATSILSGNTSIGLGQVVVSTARRGDLFADLLSRSTRSSLSHDQIARFLASDEFNIFAVAQYMRQVANLGATKSIASLPITAAEYPGIDLAAYSRHSSTWPDDNVRALASEYTSIPWDDSLRPYWGEFVFEALRDVIASGAI